MSIAIHTIEGDEPAEQAIPEALIGKWVLVSTEINGQSKRYSPRAVVFENNEYRWYCNEKLSKRAIATVDARHEPFFLNLDHQIGPSKGGIAKCIYNFKDKNTLIIAAGMIDKERPLRFDSKDAKCSSVTLWRRKTE